MKEWQSSQETCIPGAVGDGVCVMEVGGGGRLQGAQMWLDEFGELEVSDGEMDDVELRRRADGGGGRPQWRQWPMTGSSSSS